MDALQKQIENVLCGTANPVIELLQVHGRLVVNPTPPAVDIYPADPFQQAFTMGTREFFFNVRARVSTAENEGGQDLLLSMMDPEAATSMSAAILSDRTLGGKVDNLKVDGPSGFGVFPVPASSSGAALLGCTWQVEIYP
jgi:hypothetical protein